MIFAPGMTGLTLLLLGLAVLGVLFRTVLFFVLASMMLGVFSDCKDTLIYETGKINVKALSRIYVVIYGFRGLTPQQIGNKKENENRLLTLNQTEYQRSEEYC